MKLTKERYKWSGSYNTKLIEKAVKAKLTPIDSILGVTPVFLICDEFGEMDELGDFQ